MSDVDIAHDEEPPETLALLQRTQDVVDLVLARFNGRDDVHPSDVEQTLREQIALAGLPEQPAVWIRNTAIELVNHRAVIIDARTHVTRPG